MSGTTPINTTTKQPQQASSNNNKKSKKGQSKKKNRNQQNQQHPRVKTGKNPHYKKLFHANYSVPPQQPQVRMVTLSQPAPIMLHSGSVMPMNTIPMSMPITMSMPMAIQMPMGTVMLNTSPPPQHMMQPMINGQIQVMGVVENGGVGTFQPPLPPSSLPEGWSEHYTSNGVKYYYDANTGTSTYEAPAISVKKNSSPIKQKPVVVSMEEKLQILAKKKYADKSLQERAIIFKKFLKDHDISYEIKWQEAQRMILKKMSDDHKKEEDLVRYFVLFTNGERKQMFSEFCTQGQKEMKLKEQAQIKQKKDKLNQLFNKYLISQENHANDELTWNELLSLSKYEPLRRDLLFQEMYSGTGTCTKINSNDQFENELLNQFLTERKRQFKVLRREKRKKIQQKLVTWLQNHQDELMDHDVDHMYLTAKLKDHFWSLLDETQVDFYEEIQKESKKYVYEWLEDFIDHVFQEQVEIVQMILRRRRSNTSRTFDTWETFEETIINGLVTLKQEEEEEEVSNAGGLWNCKCMQKLLQILEKGFPYEWPGFIRREFDFIQKKQQRRQQEEQANRKRRRSSSITSSTSSSYAKSSCTRSRSRSRPRIVYDLYEDEKQEEEKDDGQDKKARETERIEENIRKAREKRKKMESDIDTGEEEEEEEEEELEEGEEPEEGEVIEE